MKREFISIFILCMLLGSIPAQTVAPEEAIKAGSHYLDCNISAVRHLHIAENGIDTFYYVIGSENGYAIISGNKNCLPLLAFSFTSSFDNDNLIPPVAMWLKHYQSQLLNIKKQQLLNPIAQSLWLSVLNEKRISKNSEEIAPFLASKWGQGKRYNYYCPKDLRGENGRAVIGCVATAMAQIMYYFRFPLSGVGSYQYEHEQYGTISADFEENIYDYDAMTDRPENINLAASLLNFHLGVSVDMVYGANASGMYNHKAAYSMSTHFKYSPDTQYVFRDSVITNWDSLIVLHLAQKIPLYYAGWSVPHTDGHAFVCDGYKLLNDSNYYYHFNFGWDGAFDGYFYTNALSPGGSNFNLAQELIINAYPDTNLYDYPYQALHGSKILYDEAGSFTDGSTPFGNYAPNMDYLWRIMPDIDNLSRLSLSLHYDIGAGDSLFISSSDPTIPDILFTADSSLYLLSVNSTDISVRFKTGNTPNQNRSGFTCHYSSLYEQFCNATEYFTERSGVIEDGSGSSNYNNYTRCIKSIRLGNVQYIQLNFDQFDTEENKDILYIYDASSSSPVLLQTLSGHFEDSTLLFNTRRLDLIFETSENNNYPGWRCSYSSGTTGIENLFLNDSYSIYPNPANDYFYLKRQDPYSSNLQEYCNFILYDLTGRALLSSGINQQESQKIDVSHLSSGSYILQIRNGKYIIQNLKLLIQ